MTQRLRALFTELIFPELIEIRDLGHREVNEFECGSAARHLRRGVGEASRSRYSDELIRNWRGMSSNDEIVDASSTTSFFFARTLDIERRYSDRVAATTVRRDDACVPAASMWMPMTHERACMRRAICSLPER